MTSNIKDNCNGGYWCGAYLNAAPFRDSNTVTYFHLIWPSAFHQNRGKNSTSLPSTVKIGKP